MGKQVAKAAHIAAAPRTNNHARAAARNKGKPGLDSSHMRKSQQAQGFSAAQAPVGSAAPKLSYPSTALFGSAHPFGDSTKPFYKRIAGEAEPDHTNVSHSKAHDVLIDSHRVVESSGGPVERRKRKHAKKTAPAQNLTNVSGRSAPLHIDKYIIYRHQNKKEVLGEFTQHGEIFPGEALPTSPVDLFYKNRLLKTVPFRHFASQLGSKVLIGEPPPITRTERKPLTPSQQNAFIEIRLNDGIVLELPQFMRLFNSDTDKRTEKNNDAFITRLGTKMEMAKHLFKDAELWANRHPVAVLHTHKYTDAAFDVAVGKRKTPAELKELFTRPELLSRIEFDIFPAATKEFFRQTLGTIAVSVSRAAAKDAAAIEEFIGQVFERKIPFHKGKIPVHINGREDYDGLVLPKDMAKALWALLNDPAVTVVDAEDMLLETIGLNRNNYIPRNLKFKEAGIDVSSPS